MKIAVIGGGIGGLTIAYLLGKQGHKVKLFEKTNQLGGLARTAIIDGKSIEIYYHHYNKTDTVLFALCKELGVKMTSSEAKMGYYSGGVIYDFNTPLDLLKFTPLALRDKINFALSWIFKLDCNKKVYDTIWKPLLIHKFGEHYKNIKMSWIYSRPRCNGKLYYIEGSTQVLIDKLQEKILGFGGEIHLNTESDGDKYDFLIDTTPCIKDMLPVTCLVVAWDKPISKYYWLNIGDTEYPFGLVVQKDNITYMVRYGKADKKSFLVWLTFCIPQIGARTIKDMRLFYDDYAQEINPVVEDRELNNIIKKAYKTVDRCY